MGIGKTMGCDIYFVLSFDKDKIFIFTNNLIQNIKKDSPSSGYLTINTLVLPEKCTT